MTDSNQHSILDVRRRFVLALDDILNALLANDLGGMEEVRLFNIRMRAYSSLPARVRKQIPTPWYLEPESR